MTNLIRVSTPRALGRRVVVAAPLGLLALLAFASLTSAQVEG
jgi:hypothetical protein